MSKTTEIFSLGVSFGLFASVLVLAFAIRHLIAVFFIVCSLSAMFLIWNSYEEHRKEFEELLKQR